MPQDGSATLWLPGICPPAPSTSAASSMSSPATSTATTSAISSPASAAGPSRSVSPDGAVPSGPAPVRVSRFRAQDSARAMPIADTSGPLFTHSSPSAALQRSLESRLRARMGASGSPEYALTWKAQDMPSGPPICALRARARRTSASACSGWPTPMAGTPAQKGYNEAGNNDSSRKTVALLAGWPSPKSSDQSRPDANRTGERRRNLDDYAHLAGWPTPRSFDGTGAAERQRVTMPDRQRSSLAHDGLAALHLWVAGWATPRQSDGEKNVRSPQGATREIERKGAQNDLGLVSGLMPSGSPASTASRGALSPLFSLWLMLGDASAVVAWAKTAPATRNRRGSAC
jgi:hypothetical protein